MTDLEEILLFGLSGSSLLIPGMTLFQPLPYTNLTLKTTKYYPTCFPTDMSNPFHPAAHLPGDPPELAAVGGCDEDLPARDPAGRRTQVPFPQPPGW